MVSEFINCQFRSGKRSKLEGNHPRRRRPNTQADRWETRTVGYCKQLLLSIHSSILPYTRPSISITAKAHRSHTSWLQYKYLTVIITVSAISYRNPYSSRAESVIPSRSGDARKEEHSRQLSSLLQDLTWGKQSIITRYRTPSTIYLDTLISGIRM